MTTPSRFGSRCRSEDFDMALPQRPRGGDELLLLQREHLAAHDAGHREPLDQPQAKNEDDDAGVRHQPCQPRTGHQFLRWLSKALMKMRMMMRRGME